MSGINRNPERPCHRLLHPDEIERHLDRGYRILDPHLHTAVSPDVIPAPNVQPRHLYDFMRQHGWSFVTFTDHDLMGAYGEIPTAAAGLVRGVEIKIRPRRAGPYTHTHTIHVNVYQLSAAQFADLESIAAGGQLEGFLDYLRSARLPHVLNHPFWHEVSEVPNWEMITWLLATRRFEVTEYNWGRIPEQNLHTLEMARALGIAVWGGSDNHEGRPEYATLVEGDTFEEAWENVKAGRAFIVQQHLERGGRRILVRDQGDYHEYVMDCLERGADQLMRVESRALRAKPVRYDTQAAWRELLVRFATSGEVNRFIPTAWLVGRVMAGAGERARMKFAGPYVRQQVLDIPEVRRVVRELAAAEPAVAPDDIATGT